MTNYKFLDKFDGSKGEGFIVFYGDKPAASIGTGVMCEYSIREASVSNTSSLSDGYAEAWTKPCGGPYFPHVEDVHLTKEAAQLEINNRVAEVIACRQRQVDALNAEINHFSQFSTAAQPLAGQDVRARFESWMISENCDVTRNKYGDYAQNIETRWRAWQKALTFHAPISQPNTAVVAFSCARRASDPSNEFAACRKYCGGSKCLAAPSPVNPTQEQA